MQQHCSSIHNARRVHGGCSIGNAAARLLNVVRLLYAVLESCLRVRSMGNGVALFSANGGAARKCQVGDRIIIASYGQFSEQEAAAHKPKLVYLNQDNSVERSANTIPVQLAG